MIGKEIKALYDCLVGYLLRLYFIQALVQKPPESGESNALYERLLGYLKDSKPLYAIQALVTKHPEVLKQVDNDNRRTLLHWACHYNSSVEVINFLVGVAPHALYLLDGENRTPLHHACLHKTSSLEVVNLLVETGPAAVGMLDDSNWSPLSFACQINASLPVVQILVEKYPEALGIQTRYGYTPLHYACNGGTKNVIEYLVNRGPAVACLLQERTGKLPFDWAGDQQNAEDGLIDFLSSATIEAACALIDAIWKGRKTLPWRTMAHVMETISSAVTSIDINGENTVMHQAARSQLDIATAKAMVKSDEVQHLLRQEHFAATIVWDRSPQPTPKPTAPVHDFAVQAIRELLCIFLTVMDRNNTKKHVLV